MAIPAHIPTSSDKMFEHYLYRIGLREDDIPEVQCQEMKKAFFAGISNVIVLFTVDAEFQEVQNVIGNLNDEMLSFWDNFK